MYAKVFELDLQLRSLVLSGLAMETVWGERMNQDAESVPKKGLQLRDSGVYPTMTLEGLDGGQLSTLALALN